MEYKNVCNGFIANQTLQQHEICVYFSNLIRVTNFWSQT
jgi:hypothetical protein